MPAQCPGAMVALLAGGWDGMGWDGLSGPALTDAGGASSSHSLVHGETLGPLQKGVSQALEIKLHMYSLKLHK